jgi:hypothetical protein
VREADRHLEGRSLELGPVADADDLELTLEAGADAQDHVGDEAPRQPVQRTVRTPVRRPGDDELAVLLADPDRLHHRVAQLALGAGHDDLLACDVDRHPVGDRDRRASDSAHLRIPLTTPSR